MAEEQAPALGPDERAQLEASIAAITATVSDVLARATNASQALGLVSVLHKNLDRAVAMVCTPDLAAELRPECKAGCSHCCSSRVELTEPEALLIARHVGQMAASQKSALIESLEAQAQHHFGDAVVQTRRLSCAFLQDNRCTIYPLRPATCRKAHSLSAKACETHAPLIPQNLQILLHCEALMTGSNEAFKRQGLQVSTHELASGVLTALAKEDALGDWYQPHRASQT
jgi:uncharacterized protein